MARFASGIAPTGTRALVIPLILAALIAQAPFVAFDTPIHTHPSAEHWVLKYGIYNLNVSLVGSQYIPQPLPLLRFGYAGAASPALKGGLIRVYVIAKQPSSTEVWLSEEVMSGFASDGVYSRWVDRQRSTAYYLKTAVLAVRLSRKRNRLEIYAQIIKCISYEPLSLSEIALYAKTNFKLAKEYLGFLASKGLIEKVLVDGKPHYRATQKGLEFLHQANALLGFLA